MAASIARKFATILVALAVVGSMAVGPALADDDGDIDVSSDGVSAGGDDGSTVSAGDDGNTNGSTTVSAEADSDGDVDGDVSVSGGDGDGTDGSVDCDVTTDPDCETSGTDGGDSGGGAPSAGDAPDAPDAPETSDTPEAPDVGAGDVPEEDAPDPGDGGGVSMSAREVETPDENVETSDLPIPVDYDEDVPFEALPPFCQSLPSGDDLPQPVDPTDPFGSTPVNKSRLPSEIQEPPSTPVGNPVGLVGVPINQCTVFNPYQPQVNPTNPPDDPKGEVDVYQGDIGADGGVLISRGTVETADGADERGPGGDAFVAAWADREESGLVLDADGTDGSNPSGASADIRSPNQPNRTDAVFGAIVFGKTAGASLNCDGSQCKPKASGVPSGNAVPAIPAGGGGGGSSIPCEPPVSPQDAAGQVPVDPTDPPGPDKIRGQPVPPQTPVGNPVGLVGLPLSYCDVVNPNDPPVNPEDPPQNPDGNTETYEREVGQDGVKYLGRTEAQTGEGDGTQQVDGLYFVEANQNDATGILIIKGDDGSKPYYSESELNYQPGTKKGDAFTTFTAFGKSAGATLTCDGSKCKPKANGVPSGNAVPAISTGGGGDGGDQPEPDPSADTGEPDFVDVGGDGVIIYDDRGASLGDGLPEGENEIAIIGGQEDDRVEQEGGARTGQGNDASTEADYERGAYPGDDDAQATARGYNGAGAKINLECQDYDCSYRGSTIYFPSTPGPAPSPGSLAQTLFGML